MPIIYIEIQEVGKMKFLFIATFILGIFAGVWLTGNTFSMSTLVTQNCTADKKAQVVLLNNIKVSNPIGKLTCGHGETIDKGVAAFDKGVDVVDKGLDEANKSLDKSKPNDDLDSIGFGFDE